MYTSLFVCTRKLREHRIMVVARNYTIL